MKNRALFLDRDGVINIDTGYVHRVEDFSFNEGVFDLVSWASKNHYLVIIVTNQAGIGRGFYSEKQFMDLMSWVSGEFKSRHLNIDAVYFSPYHPTDGIGKYKIDSFCRKPNPGMILKAAEDFSIDLSRSIMVGDRVTDMIAGQHAGIRQLYLVGDQQSCEYQSFAGLQDLIMYLRSLGVSFLPDVL